MFNVVKQSYPSLDIFFQMQCYFFSFNYNSAEVNQDQILTHFESHFRTLISV